MAREYSKVLAALGHRQVVLGRGSASANDFEQSTGIKPSTGPLEEQLGSLSELPPVAIVTVNAMHLAEVTDIIARRGVARILVEKPAALDRDELELLLAVQGETGVDIRIGYNRRFMASVLEARRIIADDGGALSVSFDFSEPSRRIESLDKPQRELDTWFYGNSTHVVDLALHLSGGCVEASGSVAGSVRWASSPGIYVGHGRSATDTLISWHADWMGPGRWGLQVVTPERRLILQPLERLRIQDHATFAEHEYELDLELDTEFKPGLMRQVRAFLHGEMDAHLATLGEHADKWPAYEVIRAGGALGGSEGLA